MKNTKKSAVKIQDNKTKPAAPVAKPEENRAEDQARAQLASICEMVEALRKADAGDDESRRLAWGNPRRPAHAGNF
jgi:hypothetical protein